MNTPHLISWNLTRRCNLACGHCYLDAVQRRNEAGGELDTAEALRVVREIAGLAPGAMLVLTGGEPLLRKDLEPIVEAAAQAGLMPVIGTNGCLLTDDRAKRLKERGAAGVGISLDSTTPAFHDRLRGQAGAWSGALAGMAAARAAGLGLLMQTTLFAENRSQLAGLADLARETGAMALNFFFLVCTGRGVTQTDLSPQAYEETLDEILSLQGTGLMIRARCAPYVHRLENAPVGEPSTCLAGRSYLRIGPTGDVTPCPYIPTAEGNLRRQPLREIWEQGTAFIRLRNERPSGKCGSCDFRLRCGGCRARALAAGGDLMAADPKCAYQPPLGTEPEGTIRAPILIWTTEAEALLGRIPAFVRGRIRANLERKALAAGKHRIDAAFLHAHRPVSLPFGRPSLFGGNEP